MNKRLLAVLALVAALGLSIPAAADHGDKDKGHHGNKHDDWDDDHGWERRDGYEYRTYGAHDERPPGWGHGKKTGWGKCGMPPGQPRNMDAERTCTNIGPSTTTKMKLVGLSCVAPLSKCTAA